jgi:hypothetical protein
MARESPVRKWGWPSRVALLLGLGALAVPDARADLPGTSRDNEESVRGAVIRAEGGRIYLSENGRETELRLGTSPEREHLVRLLEEHGAGGVKLDRDPRLIMSSGGGSGFSLRDTPRSVFGDPPPTPRDPPPPAPQNRDPAGRERKPASDKKG